MRAKMLEALGLIAFAVQRRKHNILGSISATENSRLLANASNIWSLEFFDISCHYPWYPRTEDVKTIS